MTSHDLPEGAAGYPHDPGKQLREHKKKLVKMQKKVNKLTKKNKVVRRK